MGTQPGDPVLNCPQCGEPCGIAPLLPLPAIGLGEAGPSHRQALELLMASRWSVHLPMTAGQGTGTSVPDKRKDRRTYEQGPRPLSCGRPTPTPRSCPRGVKGRGHSKAPLSPQAGTVPGSQILPSPEAPFAKVDSCLWGLEPHQGTSAPPQGCTEFEMEARGGTGCI